jgi:hypothetical protein
MPFEFVEALPILIPAQLPAGKALCEHPARGVEWVAVVTPFETSHTPVPISAAQRSSHNGHQGCPQPSELLLNRGSTANALMVSAPSC